MKRSDHYINGGTQVIKSLPSRQSSFVAHNAIPNTHNASNNGKQVHTSGDMLSIKTHPC